jgi:hypothetical protein
MSNTLLVDFIQSGGKESYQNLLKKVRVDATLVGKANISLDFEKKQNNEIGIPMLEKILSEVLEGKQEADLDDLDADQLSGLAVLEGTPVKVEVSAASKQTVPMYKVYAKRPPGPNRKLCCDAIVLEHKDGKIFGRQCRRSSSSILTGVDVDAAKQGLCKQHQCNQDQIRYATMDIHRISEGDAPVTTASGRTEIQDMFCTVVTMLKNNEGDNKHSVDEIQRFMRKRSDRIKKAYVEQVRIGLGQITQYITDRPSSTITAEQLSQIQLFDEKDTEDLCDESEPDA